MTVFSELTIADEGNQYFEYVTFELIAIKCLQACKSKVFHKNTTV